MIVYFLGFLFRRCCWGLVMICCVYLFFVKTMNLVVRFCDCPTRTQHHFTYNHTMGLPAFTVCPHDMFDDSKLDVLWNHHFGYSVSDSLTKYYKLADVVDVKELWWNVSHSSPAEVLQTVFI